MSGCDWVYHALNWVEVYKVVCSFWLILWTVKLPTYLKPHVGNSLVREEVVYLSFYQSGVLHIIALTFPEPSYNCINLPWTLLHLLIQVKLNLIFSYASSSTLYPCESVSGQSFGLQPSSVAWSLRACLDFIKYNGGTFIYAISIPQKCVIFFDKSKMCQMYFAQFCI